MKKPPKPIKGLMTGELLSFGEGPRKPGEVPVTFLEYAYNKQWETDKSLFDSGELKEIEEVPWYYKIINQHGRIEIVESTNLRKFRPW